MNTRFGKLLNRSMLLTTVAFVTLALSAETSQAQLNQQTGVADPGRVQGDLLKSQTFRPLSPPIDIKQMELLGVPEGSEDIKLQLDSVQLDGASALPESTIRSVYADKLGSEVSLADVYRIANQITLKYREEGYILTQVVVPPQVIEDGSVRLQVVEGFINRASIQTQDDETAYETAHIKALTDAIVSGDALNVRDLERQLLLINDLPGVNARSILSPSADAPGGADLLVIVERDPFDALLGIDNYGSRYLGPVTLTGAATANSWLGWNEAITAQVAMAPDGGEMKYGALKYEQPIGTWGTKASILGSVADTDPGYDLERFAVRGRSQLVTLRVDHPFIRARSENLYGHALFDWRDVRSSNNIELTRKDHIRALRTGLDYEFLDQLIGIGFNTVGFELSKGLNVMGASDEDDLNMTRPSADPQATKLTASVQRLQRLTDSFNLLLAGSGQLSSGALLSSEEFGVGGINNGRGYDPSEVVGDEGIAGRAEVQWNNPMAIQGGYLDKFQAFTFLDSGRVWNDDATTSQGKRDSITSVGGGVRMNFTGGLESSLGVAVPLTRRVQTQGDRDPKVYFSLNKRF
jgi:hemolysin activation/secretion protein